MEDVIEKLKALASIPIRPDFITRLMQYHNDLSFSPSLLSLLYALLKEGITEIQQCTLTNIILILIQCLPQNLFRFIQECCNYLNLLKRNVDDDDRYFAVLNNFTVFITNYLVSLHGIYVTKHTPGTSSALSIDEYFGKATFTAKEQKAIYTEYSIVVKTIVDRLFKNKAIINVL